jgi:type I site-specific restriction-modification system R (restriction) subunit
MKVLNLPSYSFKLVRDGKKTKIFDAIRKAYIVLTPEEWVRQNLVEYLVQELNFPRNLIAIERGLSLNGLKKRTDILVYNKKGEPILMVECKAPSIKINQSVFDQIGRYNISFKLPYLVVSNGIDHYCAKVDFKEKDFSFLPQIPNYEEL